MYISSKTLCQKLSIAYNTLYKLMAQGLPYVRIGRDYRFKIEDVERWLNENTEKVGGEKG